MHGKFYRSFLSNSARRKRINDWKGAVGKTVYVPKWLVEHDIEDYRTVGITAGDLEKILPAAKDYLTFEIKDGKTAYDILIEKMAALQE